MARSSKNLRTLFIALAGGFALSGITALGAGHAIADKGLRCVHGDPTNADDDLLRQMSGTQTFPPNPGQRTPRTIMLTFEALMGPGGNPHKKMYTIKNGGVLKNTKIIGTAPANPASDGSLFVYSPKNNIAFQLDYVSYHGDPLNPDIQPGLNLIMANPEAKSKDDISSPPIKPIISNPFFGCDQNAEINPQDFKLPENTTVFDLRTSSAAQASEPETATKQKPPIVDVRALDSNPFPYKGRLVVVPGTWSKMLSETDAYLLPYGWNAYGVVVADMDFTTFQAGSSCLVALEVNGKRTFQGLQPALVTAVTYIGQSCSSRTPGTEEIDWQYLWEQLPRSGVQSWATR